MKRSYLLFFKVSFFTLMVSISTGALAQNVGINGTGATPVASAGLDVDFTDKGVLIPRVVLTATNAAGPVAAPATSLLVYNTATAGVAPNNVTPGYYYWNGAAWVRFSTGGDDWKILGNANTTAGTNFLGTTNTQALDFRTNNILRFRVAYGNQVHAMADGTAALPFYSFSNNTNMGMYRIGADILGLSIAGAERLRFTTTEAVFNDVSNNYDFRVESDALANMFFVDASANNIGINTAAPANMLHFESDGRASWVTNWMNSSANGALKKIEQSNAANGSRVLLGSTNYNLSLLAAASVMGLSLNATITGAGGIGVLGAANNESGNAVEGSLSFSGGYTGWAGYFNADVGCAGVYVGSDRRLKKDIKPIAGALQLIKKVEPVSYYMDTEKYPEIGFDEDRLSFGFIAQDLEKVIPEMVKEKNLVLNSNKMKDTGSTMERKVDLFKVVNYTLMIPIAVQAIKEQQIIIETQNSRIAALEKAIEELKNKK